MTATLLAPAPDTAATTWTLARLRRAHRPYGWTIWYGAATGQYWAAHTRTMVLLSGDDAADLAAAIDRFGRTTRPRVPYQRRPPIPSRPRPRRA